MIQNLAPPHQNQTWVYQNSAAKSHY
jgi:hypothetical protein